MPILSKPTPAPLYSITYITIGVVMAIPSAVWYALFHPTGVGRFVCVSLLLLGLAFVAIGLLVGPVARLARHAELPPKEVTGLVAQAEPPAPDAGGPAARRG